MVEDVDFKMGAGVMDTLDAMMRVGNLDMWIIISFGRE